MSKTTKTTKTTKIALPVYDLLKVLVYTDKGTHEFFSSEATIAECDTEVQELLREESATLRAGSIATFNEGSRVFSNFVGTWVDGRLTAL